MDREAIAHQCAAMHDQELVRALTLDKTEYSDEFRIQAMRELAQRGTPLESFLDLVAVQRESGVEERLTLTQALALSRDEVPLWSLRIFRNILDESLVLQRELQWWICHHYHGDEYKKSFFVQSPQALQEILQLFLRLEEWEHLLEVAYDLDKWTTIEKSNSREYIGQIAADLYRGEVPHTVQTPQISQDREGLLALLVPPEYLDKTEEVLGKAAENLQDLYHRATLLAAANKLGEELEVYDLLIQANPTNPAVFYNRGSILLELGRQQEAAESFIEAVSLGIEEAEREARLNAGRGSRGAGGMFGLAAKLLKKNIPTADEGPVAAPYPDFIDDAELFLQQLQESIPGDKKILHCLASISRLKNETGRAEERYNAILALEPTDPIARFYLGYAHAAKEGEK